jgi:hypothetical protein
MSSIGVLLTSHARTHTLRPQLRAIDRQTVRPDELIIWHDHAEGVRPDTEAMRGRKVVATNYTSGVWNRFAFCLWGFDTEYVAVFDDDTVPGEKWLEYMLSCHRQRAALYGVNGVRFPTGNRKPREYTGLDPVIVGGEVDIVGHAWFFRRSLLQRACSLPRCPGIESAGEDYHLAYAAQNRKLPVLVAPVAVPSHHGSLNPQLGTDDKALYRQPGEEEKKQRVHDFYLSQGWKPMALRNKDEIHPRLRG